MIPTSAHLLRAKIAARALTGRTDIHAIALLDTEEKNAKWIWMSAHLILVAMVQLACTFPVVRPLDSSAITASAHLGTWATSASSTSTNVGHNHVRMVGYARLEWTSSPVFALQTSPG